MTVLDITEEGLEQHRLLASLRDHRIVSAVAVQDAPGSGVVDAYMLLLDDGREIRFADATLTASPG